VLVAGATGALGRRVAAQFGACGGVDIRLLARDRARAEALRLPGAVCAADALRPATLAGAFDKVDIVFSCVGASVMPSLAGWRRFGRVDTPANLHLLAAARAAGVHRFVYVSCAHTPAMRGLDYVRAHERVVDALADSGLEWIALRPTGFFSALGFLVDAARKGRAPLLGAGVARSNPIHDDDLAAIAADAVLGGVPKGAHDVGGPEVLTRCKRSELAAAAGRPGAVRRVPRVVARLASLALRPVHPRVAALMAFFAALDAQDVIVEPRGTRTLADDFATRARETDAHRPQ
jgi:uncharacterized protein YbjT (DUF2867 family)